MFTLVSIEYYNARRKYFPSGLTADIKRLQKWFFLFFLAHHSTYHILVQSHSFSLRTHSVEGNNFHRKNLVCFSRFEKLQCRHSRQQGEHQQTISRRNKALASGKSFLQNDFLILLNLHCRNGMSPASSSQHSLTIRQQHVYRPPGCNAMPKTEIT